MKLRNYFGTEFKGALPPEDGGVLSEGVVGVIPPPDEGADILPGLDDEGADMLPGLDDEGAVMPAGSDVELEPDPDVEDGLAGQRLSDGLALQSFLSLLFDRGFSGVELPEEDPPDDGEDCANP